MQQNDNAPQPARRNRRVRKKKHPPLYWILRGLMIVSFCCFLVFLSQIVVPKIQARSVKNRIPVPGTGNAIVQAAATPSPNPEAAEPSAAPEEAAETEEDANLNREDQAPISEDFLELKSLNPDVMG